MKFVKGPVSFNIKMILVVVALIIAIATLWYTNSIVKKLQEREKQIVTLYAKGLEYVANSEAVGIDYTFIFENIIQPIDFPLILTDENDNFNLNRINEDMRNIEIDTTLKGEKLENFIRNLLIEMDSNHQPISVSFSGKVFQRIHYGDSYLIKQLKIYPYVQLVIAALFILIAYIGFSYIKKSEQSNIWVGMSKETAHQLGTPLSSLMGWLELLKLNYKDPEKVLDTLDEMSNDLERLKKIADRFSKIGSVPDLKKENINSVIDKVVSYFERRLPQSGKSIDFVFNSDKQYYALINPELFEWVIENLTKNALDAIESKTGKITYQIIEKGKNLFVDVTDSGKGIEMRYKNEIFRPGFSTKKRGWGLGLSLSKRIIEEYHRGKIFVKSSIIGQGTTFRISLRT
ncbi:MAG: HAMP domain-containing histidine kinase [Ignavibacteria bacterium]|nr:HAMP domain-containing histidine kinase [Ignavibacteria bacterium]